MQVWILYCKNVRNFVSEGRGGKNLVCHKKIENCHESVSRAIFRELELLEFTKKLLTILEKCSTHFGSVKSL